MVHSLFLWRICNRTNHAKLLCTIDDVTIVIIYLTIETPNLTLYFVSVVWRPDITYYNIYKYIKYKYIKYKYIKYKYTKYKYIKYKCIKYKYIKYKYIKYKYIKYKYIKYKYIENCDFVILLVQASTIIIVSVTNLPTAVA